MATSLVSVNRDHVKARIEHLQAELAAELELLSESKPVEPTDNEAMIRFKKFGYSWGAIRVFTDPTLGAPSVRWFITQDGSRSARQGIPAKTWVDLLEWMSERNWDTIKVMS